jgi:hypothetical protein
MEYFRIIITLKEGTTRQGVREFPHGTDQQEAYFQVWRKAISIYTEGRLDSIKVERLHDQHPHVLHFLRRKADLDGLTSSDSL